MPAPGRRHLAALVAACSLAALPHALRAESNAVEHQLPVSAQYAGDPPVDEPPEAAPPTTEGGETADPPTAESDRTAEAPSPVDPGIRRLLEEAGIAVHAGYVSDLFANVRGGVASRGGVMHNLETRLTLDGERALGIPGATVSVRALANWGAGIGVHVGDVQGISNIEAPASLHLYEAWVQQEFAGGRLSVLAGLLDLNGEFYVKERAGTLVNASWGIGPEYALSGAGGPSIFPRTALGLRIAARPTDGLVLRSVVLDGHPGVPGERGQPRIELSRAEGALVNVEAEWHPWRRALAPAEGPVVKGGAWWYTSPRPRIDDATRRAGVHGAYAVVETPLVGGERPAWLFGHLGAADSRANRIAWSWGAGVSWSAPLSHRPDDELALGVVGAIDGAHFRSARPGGWSPGERTLEATYLYSLGDWGAVQPDVQWVVDPGASTTTPDALLFGLRLHLAF